jgi:hypothetical protein
LVPPQSHTPSTIAMKCDFQTAKEVVRSTRRLSCTVRGRRAKDRRAAIAFAVFVAAWISGCAEPPLEYTEVTRVHEVVTESEAAAFRGVVGMLPGGRIPAITPIFAPPPDWSESRTLPVTDLVQEEQARLNERWDVDRLAAEWDGNRALERALRKHRMTVQQFAGLTLTLGVALTRSSIRENQLLPQLKEKGIAEVAHLREENRSFASLSEDGRHHVLQRAIWITRLDRAQRLLHVPPENVELVQRKKEQWMEIFPKEFSLNPFDDISDLLEERGLPFLELTSSGSDAELEWNREEAVIGRDTPDE